MGKLFQRPKLEPKEYLAQLHKEITVITTELESLKESYVAKSIELNNDFEAERDKKQRELGELENTLVFKRMEQAELAKPFNTRTQELNERESALKDKESQFLSHEQQVFEREREAEKKLESVQDLADQIGEARVRQLVKDKLLIVKENTLKQRENAHLLRSEELAQKANDMHAEFLEREEKVSLRELNVESRSENLLERESTLAKANIMLRDREQMLKRGFDELRLKQNGSTERPQG